MPKQKVAPNNDDQHRRFVETARELGCDEDEAAFEEKLRRIATAKPMLKSPKKPTKVEPKSKREPKRKKH
jgi:hypothetical protein